MSSGLNRSMIEANCITQADNFRPKGHKGNERRAKAEKEEEDEGEEEEEEEEMEAERGRSGEG